MDNTSLKQAISAHQAGLFQQARRLYEQALRRQPQNPDALHFFGVLCHNMGQSDRAVGLIRHSLALLPTNAHAWLNLGNILLERDRIIEAREAYEKAVGQDSQFADGWFNLGVCLRKAEELQHAITVLDRAIALRNDHPASFYQRGIAQRDCGDFTAAEADYREALRLKPDDLSVYESLAVLLYRQGRVGDAGEVYRQWLVQEPTSAVAAHMVAATSGDLAPARASDAYIAQTFDRFAETFDRNLQELDYRAPQLIATALKQALTPGCKAAAILDAGCGTGLCGELLRPLADRLVGVDLSAGMIAKAAERRVYDSLAVAELSEFMRGQPGAFDVIVAADTLVYFGALEDALDAVHHALGVAGLLLFTLEELDLPSGSGFQILPHGRYGHTRDYLETALAGARMRLLSMESHSLRREKGSAVDGLVVTACRQ